MSPALPPNLLPLLLIRPHQPQVSFMHKRRRLQSMTRHFAGHPLGSKRSQFIIDKWKQPIRGGDITVIDRFQQKRYLRHRGFLPYQLLTNDPCQLIPILPVGRPGNNCRIQSAEEARLIRKESAWHYVVQSVSQSQ
jgi:hypothetical protein